MRQKWICTASNQCRGCVQVWNKLVILNEQREECRWFGELSFVKKGPKVNEKAIQPMNRCSRRIFNVIWVCEDVNINWEQWKGKTTKKIKRLICAFWILVIGIVTIDGIVLYVMSRMYIEWSQPWILGNRKKSLIFCYCVI